MKIIRTLGFQFAILVLSFSLIGCQMTPYQLGRNATVATLTITGADKETAQQVKDIAGQIQEATKDGQPNRQKMLEEADKQIAKVKDQRQRAILLALREQMVDIVIQALGQNQDIREAMLVIHEVARGSKDGADIVLMSFKE